MGASGFIVVSVAIGILAAPKLFRTIDPCHGSIVRKRSGGKRQAEMVVSPFSVRKTVFVCLSHHAHVTFAHSPARSPFIQTKQLQRDPLGALGALLLGDLDGVSLGSLLVLGALLGDSDGDPLSDCVSLGAHCWATRMALHSACCFWSRRYFCLLLFRMFELRCDSNIRKDGKRKEAIDRTIDGYFHHGRNRSPVVFSGD
jgi:hypothetical protein